MKEIYKALAAFQQECPVIVEEKKTKNYKYAPLPDIMTVINPLLRKHGLGFTQLIQQNAAANVIETRLFHCETGQALVSFAAIRSGVDLHGMNPYQVDGAGITYYRRYALSAILGIVTETDTDASSTQPKQKGDEFF